MTKSPQREGLRIYPMAIAYSHMASAEIFNGRPGVSINLWRETHHLLSQWADFRWQINDRWKMKMMLPEPQIEYKARDDLHFLWEGDLEGDTFRVSSDFGTRRGDPTLNNALVDYQELRAGVGFSWNIRPLIELNFQTGGYMLDRAFPIITTMAFF